MQPNTQSHPTNPLKEHALLFIGISGYMSIASAVLFLTLLPFARQLLAYWVTAAAMGLVNFPLLWRHWRRPNMLLFFAIISLLTMSYLVAGDTLFPGAGGEISWPLRGQFLCVYVFVQFSLVYLFRKRLLKSLN